MIRELETLEGREFDLLVIGAGVVGACVARDAALRGLRVALIDRADFASATSSNSLKLVHGGLRYLQRLELRAMRESVRERSTWLRLAPHLVHPIPVLVPLYGRGLDRSPILRAALALNDLASLDRNRNLDPDRTLPPGRLLSPEDCLTLVPELERHGLTGGALFYDGQMYSAERLVLGVAEGAAAAGAVIANYVEARDARQLGSSGIEVSCRDLIGDAALRIRARLAVNATGSTAFGTARSLSSDVEPLRYSVAMNIVLAGREHRCAFAVSAREGRGVRGPNKRLFVVPWRGRTMVGTAHYPLLDPAGDEHRAEPYLERFLAEVNAAWPAEPITSDQVVRTHVGLLPVVPGSAPGRVELLRRGRILEDRTAVITVASVKFTTARALAERVVDRAARRIGGTVGPCVTSTTPLPGAPNGSFAAFEESARRAHPDVDAAVLGHLLRSYGTRYGAVLSASTGAMTRVVEGLPVVVGQFAHGRTHEMAMLREDLVHRRTEIGPVGGDVATAMAVAGELTPSG